MHRFWHHAEANEADGVWTAKLAAEQHATSRSGSMPTSSIRSTNRLPAPVTTTEPTPPKSFNLSSCCKSQRPTNSRPPECARH